jgi:hypothetical protein
MPEPRSITIRNTESAALRSPQHDATASIRSWPGVTDRARPPRRASWKSGRATGTAAGQRVERGRALGGVLVVAGYQNRPGDHRSEFVGLLHSHHSPGRPRTVSRAAAALITSSQPPTAIADGWSAGLARFGSQTRGGNDGSRGRRPGVGVGTPRPPSSGTSRRSGCGILRWCPAEVAFSWFGRIRNGDNCFASVSGHQDFLLGRHEPETSCKDRQLPLSRLDHTPGTVRLAWC